LAEGNYSLKIEARGFKNLTVTNVVVKKDQQLNLDMTLELNGESTTVGIIALEPLLDTSSSAITFTLSGDQIRRLPIPKSYES
jgi:hypothetical protein